MKTEVLKDTEQVAQRAAALIAAEARSAVAERGKVVMAVSGGRTPWLMLRALANEDMPWPHIHIFQVDERIAPFGDPDRNLTLLRASLEQISVPPQQIYPMPVEATEPGAGAKSYAARIESVAGKPAVLDLVHLGLGTDGHTASLVPGDPILDVNDTDVSVTKTVYEGRRRMSMTFPLLNRARRILWLVTGAAKAESLKRLVQSDTSIPAGRVRTENALLIADEAAASALAERRTS